MHDASVSARSPTSTSTPVAAPQDVAPSPRSEELAGRGPEAPSAPPRAAARVFASIRR